MSPSAYAFGRRREPAETARAASLHPLREHLLAAAPKRRATTLHSLTAGPLDQGQTGTCVGHGWEHALLSSPIPHPFPTQDIPDPFTIYRGACTRDELPDNDDGDVQKGTSVRGAAAWLASQGLIGHYDWCQSAEDAADWIGLRDASGQPAGGPIVVGISWFWRQVTRFGALSMPRRGAQPLGGHCVALIGWDEAKHRFTGINSWGQNFGQLGPDGRRNGRFWMSLALLDRLIKAQGEACAFVEIARANV